MLRGTERNALLIPFLDTGPNRDAVGSGSDSAEYNLASVILTLLLLQVLEITHDALITRSLEQCSKFQDM